MCWRGAWSGRYDMVELETRLSRAARDHRRRQYRIALDAERRAWDALEAARGAHDALWAMPLDLAAAPASAVPPPVPAHARRSWWTTASPVHTGRTS